MQAFKRLYDNAALHVEQYNRDLDTWERQVNGKEKPKPQQKPPEKESIRKKLRDMETDAKRRNDARCQEPRHRSHDYDRSIEYFNDAIFSCNVGLLKLIGKFMS